MGCSFERQNSAAIANAFHRFLNDSKRKPNKIWLDKGSEFYNRSMESWLQDNNIEMYSTQGKSIFAERFIKTWRVEFTNT